ncbi:uncharacterized protein N7459_001737 [Penicillium hispanicum]|uniref:uncharacterized protein n=1 Tax=Penicillium hispanicum TaxID=1080232 RepID=UPI002541F51F|nr:uncharacterized protein N7459_001737 [Penicillium hispanicum]KAJ5595529.1 hypothetical protein N7459_001737 [Penicillium hispanicum]
MAKHIDDDIAVIGIGLKFPGDATSPESFSDLLLKGRSALRETPNDRYNVDSFYHPDQDRLGAVNVRYAHYLKDDIAAFDAPFFSITPNEAIYMDPQQRGLLETVYHALENAGIPMAKAVGSNASVHIGCFTREYDGVMCRDPEVDLKYIATGTGSALLSNRVSWFYDFRGPSLTLDSACSSSLNACHLAVQGLRSGESSMAIVGGCNLFYNPDTMIPLTSLGFLSPDGKCYTFDHRANGYSRGEGFGVVVLKRVSDALQDGDTIRAVIRGTSSNQDGKSPGITQPTRSGQVALIEQAYKAARLDLATTRFFEAHGTGTPMGDPIEARAISDVFTAYRAPEEPMYVGALKSNIGHLEGAAGIAGLIKVVHVLERGVIPPNIWFEKVNPKIPAEKWNLKFPTELTAWPQDGLRRASVNSFGYGGSNAHVVLDDAYHYLMEHHLVGIHRTVAKPTVPKLVPELDAEVNPYHINGNGITNGAHANGAHINGASLIHGNGINGQSTHPADQRIFLLSAYDEDGVRRLAKAYKQYLSNIGPTVDNEGTFLNDLSYTLSSKRTLFPWRASIVAKDVPSLQSALSAPVPVKSTGITGCLAFIFSGQGAQWHAMGRELMVFPVFRSSLGAADSYVKGLGCSWSLMEECLKDEESSLINDAKYSQPICTALQVALTELLWSWSVRPSAVVGHSSGEIAAAFAAGAISRESSWRIAYYRGLLCSEVPVAGGEKLGMLSAALAPEKADEYIARVNSSGPGRIVIACFNSPKNVTISGNAQKLEALQSLLNEESIFHRRLKVENAYHSSYMEVIARVYEALIGNITSPDGMTGSKSTPHFYSSLTGDRLPIRVLQTPTYWVSNLVSPVKFSQAVTQMLVDRRTKVKKLGAKQEAIEPITELLEVGPHSVLQSPLREIMEKLPNPRGVGYVSALKRNVDAVDSALRAAGWLYCRGQPVDIEMINRTKTAVPPPRLMTDLPPYVFNHSKTYWKESRLSKGYRFRQYPRLELLGAPVPDWNKSNAIWRNWIRLSENPWLKDHRITGSILYPGAGMIVMAIEASRQLANPKKVLKGFRLRDVVFQAALRVPSTTDGIETHFYVRPYFDSTSSTSSNWNEFQLSSIDGEEWRDHCRGLIQPDYEIAVNPIDNGLEAEAFVESCAYSVREAELACQKRVSPNQLYELLHTVGFDFGETFQNLSEVSINNDRGAVATVTAPNIKSKMPFGHVQPHLIHPATLDGVFQTVIVALTRGGRDAGDAMVPTSVKELWISATDTVDKSHECLRLCARADFLGLRQATASATAVDPATRKPIVTIDGFVSTTISGNNGQQATGESAHHHLCFNLDWKPDITMLDQENANRLFRAQIPSELADTDPSEVITDVERICYMYLRRYFRDHDDSKIDPSKPWYRKYISWMKHQFERHDRGELIHAAAEDWNQLAEDDIYFAQLEQKLQDSTPEAKMSVTVGRVLGPILQGAADPLEILFKDSHMENVYRHGTGAEIGYAYLASYLDALAHKNSDLVILEIGAGTGGATVPILDTLMRHGDAGGYGAARFERYDFTDISPSFFETAKQTFAKLADRMRFQTLNIEKDPLEEGFEAGTYDVIIAGNVIHATKNIDHTLRNVRKLLKPGGKFILNELANSTLVRTGFGFGLLSGWWLSEEANREWGPLMEVSDWKTHLKGTGFDDADFVFRDYEDAANQLNSVIVATASAPEPATRSLPPAFVVYKESQLKTAKILQHELESRELECEIVPLAQLTTISIRFDQKLCVFLAELEEPLLTHVDEALFKSLQQMTTSLNSIIWLSNGGGPASQSPNGELVTGFARVIRQENPTIRFLTLSINQIKGASETAQSVLRLIDEVLAKNSNDKSAPDNSFHESNGVIHISRLVEASYMNDAIALKTATPTAHEGKFGSESNRPLKLVIGSPGLLDTLQFVIDPGYELPLTDGDVEFKVMAAGLNFLDIMIALGQVIGNDLGVEGAGVVTRTAPNSKFQIGDRVCGIAAGTLNTYARAKETSIARIPDNLNWDEAAGLTVVFVTAYAAMYDIANIQPRETVLIHAAAGGVGQACIQLAQIRGAEIFATVGSVEKRDLLIEKYGIARDHIFSSRDLTFARGIKRMTKGRGVDVAVNSLSGDALRATWDCIAPFGRFAEVGKMDIYSSSRLNMENFKNNVRFEFVDISFIAANNGQRFSNILENLMDLVREENIRPLHPTQVFPFSQIQESFRYMQSGVHSGKIVLQPHDDDLVPIVPSRKSSYNFDPNASFVISGGLGGLGRSIARWMASRGAKNLILLSRSTARDSAKELVRDLEELGVRVATPPCDVSDLNSLRCALSECSAVGMPPVKGCIQGAMVLRDSTFANMTVDDYYVALRPKFDGSWNLHNELPKDLDFFILLSSISTIVGNRGQSNYNMGNTFQDGLARYRVLNGLKATALDLGMVLSVGYVAENDSDLINHLRDVGVEPMREEEFLSILDELCNPNLPATIPLTKSQISLGLQMPETRLATGAEEPGWMRDPLFRHLYRIRTLEGAAESDGRSVNYALLLAGADNFEQATEMVYEAMVGKLVKALNISQGDVDPSKPLHALGVDSLVAVELRTWMLKQLDADVAVFDLMEVASLRALATLIATRSSYVKKDDGEK